MSWTYRVLDHGDILAIHEVYLDEEGAPKAWTTEPAGVVAESREGFLWVLRAMEKALSQPALSVSEMELEFLAEKGEGERDEL